MKKACLRFGTTLLLLIGLFAGIVDARQNSPLSFDVASIKPTRPSAGIAGGRGAPGTGAGVSGPILCRGTDAGDVTPVPSGTCVAAAVTLRTVIARAYGVGMDGKTILGGPN